MTPTSHLTAPNEELDRLIKRTPPGAMMFWAGTAADRDATCGGCRFYGYETVTRNGAGNVVNTHKHPNRCALYRKHTGQNGKALSQLTPACKYHAAKQLAIPS